MERIHEAITPRLHYTAATALERGVSDHPPPPVLFHRTASSAHQAAVATIRAEWLKRGKEKRTELEWWEITKGISSMSPPPLHEKSRQVVGRAATVDGEN